MSPQRARLMSDPLHNSLWRVRDGTKIIGQAQMQPGDSLMPTHGTAIHATIITSSIARGRQHQELALFALHSWLCGLSVHDRGI